MPHSFKSATNKRQVLWIFFLATLIVLVEIAFYSVIWIVPIGLIGVGAGVLLAPGINAINRKLRLPLPLAAFLFLLLLFLAASGMFLLIYDLAANQAGAIQRNLPHLLAALQSKVSHYQSRYPWLEALYSGSSLTTTLNSLGPSLLRGLRAGTSFIVGAILVAVIAIYTGVAPMYYVEGILSFYPPARRARVQEIMLSLGRSLRQWFRAQLIAIASVGTLVAFGLFIVGIEYWLLFGLLAGFLDIIPYIGATVPAGLALLVALATAPEKAPWVLVVFISAHQLESSVLIPLVMRYRVSLPPVPLLLFMSVMASWFGLIGIVLSPGLFTILRTLYLLIYVPWINQEPR